MHFQHLVRPVYHQGMNCIRVLGQGMFICQLILIPIAIKCQCLGPELEYTALSYDIHTWQDAETMHPLCNVVLIMYLYSWFLSKSKQESGKELQSVLRRHCPSWKVCKCGPKIQTEIGKMTANNYLMSYGIHRAGHLVPHAFSTYVGYVLAQETFLTFCKHRPLSSSLMC